MKESAPAVNEPEDPAQRLTLVAWGEVLWDCLPGQPPRLGGAPANVAVHAACLGLRAVLVSRVGDDALGERALAELAGRGVDVSHVQKDSSAPTGTVEVELDAGEPRYRIREGVAWDRIVYRPDLDPTLRDAAVFCFGTLALRTAAARAAFRRAETAVDDACLRLCDLNLRAP